MGMLANIVCKGVGVAGMSAAVYDAYSVGKANSKRVALAQEADYFQKIHSETRTLGTESYINNALQERAKTWRLNNPFISVKGGIKGFVSGFLNSLGDNILPVTLASVALLGKGKAAKTGAIGVTGYTIFHLLKEGFGVFKKNPVI